MKKVKHPKSGVNFKRMHEGREKAEEGEESEEDPNYYEYKEPPPEQLPKERPIYDRVKKQLKRKIDGRGSGMVPLKSKAARERYKKKLLEKIRNGDKEVAVQSVIEDIIL